jgi:hypothetical protein
MRISKLNKNQKLISEECSLFFKKITKPKYNKSGGLKLRDGKIEYEVKENQCVFGHKCLIFANEVCPNFTESVIEEYKEMRKKYNEKQEKSRL